MKRLVLRDLRNCKHEKVYRILAHHKNDGKNKICATYEDISKKKKKRKTAKVSRNAAAKQSKLHQHLLYTEVLMVLDFLP